VETVAAQAASDTIAAARRERPTAEPDRAAEVTRRAAEALPGYVDQVSESPAITPGREPTA
jgi:hypothetical protein